MENFAEALFALLHVKEQYRMFQPADVTWHKIIIERATNGKEEAHENRNNSLKTEDLLKF